jgi:ubiquinone/menaquinone biosynthesis C-methylase UbiE
MSDEKKMHFLEKQILEFPDFECEDGWVLDFGGGGEGIIGQVKGNRVIAIDCRQSELEEALERDCKALLVVMDGTDLKFLDNTFPTATAFFSLMYVMESADFEKIFKEIYRVLKPRGKFLIWDANLNIPKESAYKIIAFHLEIFLPSGKKVETGYGTPKSHQKMEDFLVIAKKVGFEILSSQNSEVQFYLELRKP